jgi:hypothetical protein
VCFEVFMLLKEIERQLLTLVYVFVRKTKSFGNFTVGCWWFDNFVS